MSGLCGARGPRIGEDGTRCRRIPGHAGDHMTAPADGFGDVRWSNLGAPVPDRPAAEREGPQVSGWCPRCGEAVPTNHSRPECDGNYVRKRAAAERVGSEREAGLSEALEAACLEGLVETPHGYRYRPSVGAAAVERILADRLAALRAQQATEVAEAVRVAKDEERAAWSSWLDSWTGAVGPEPPTVEAVADWLRADTRPFGIARAAREAEGGGERG